MFAIGDILKSGVRNFPNKEAIVFEDVRLTYRAFNDRVNRLASAMISLGHLQGTTLSILSQNTYKYLEVYLAAAKMGSPIVPLDFMFSDDELIQTLQESEATICIVGDGYEQVVERIRPALPNVTAWIAMTDGRENFIDYEDLMFEASPHEIQMDVDQDALAVLVYKRGTSGRPKGVMLSHRNILNSAKARMELLDLRPTDAGCYVLPFYQTEIVNALCMLMAGGKVVVNRRVDAAEVLRLVQDEKCTHINMVPTLYDWLLQHPHFERYNLASLKLLTYCGSAFPPDKLTQCVKTFWKRFAQSYGSTETAGCSITALGSEDHILEGPGSKLLASAGKPLNGAVVKIVDRDTKPLNAGEIGEVIVKSQNVMMGYWKQPELTQQVLKEGWLHTGDVGYLDSNGYLYVLGRKDNPIGRTRSESVSLKEGTLDNGHSDSDAADIHPYMH